MASEVERALEQLSAADARDEAFAVFEPERRVLGVRRASKLRPIGRVWRLGVLLLARDGALYATGSLTRAVEPGRRGYQSESAEVRRDYRAAAYRGRFPHGETVNFDARALDPESEDPGHPLERRGGQLFVHWNGSADPATAVPLGGYLAERVDLLVHPPQGA